MAFRRSAATAQGGDLDGAANVGAGNGHRDHTAPAQRPPILERNEVRFATVPLPKSRAALPLTHPAHPVWVLCARDSESDHCGAQHFAFSPYLEGNVPEPLSKGEGLPTAVAASTAPVHH